MKNIIFITSLLFLWACNNCEQYQNEVYQQETFAYQLDSAGMAGINKYLVKYQEPELGQLKQECYRLIWSNVFNDTAHVITIGKDLTFIHKKLPKNPDSTRIIAEKIEIKLLKREWRALQQSVYKNKYWTLPREIDRYGCDGGTWIIEGRRPDAARCGKRDYHIVSRWSPEEGDFRNLCETIMNIANAKNEIKNE